MQYRYDVIKSLYIIKTFAPESILYSFFSSRFADNYFIDDYARFSTLDTVEKNTAVANSMNYMTKKGKSTLASDH